MEIQKTALKVPIGSKIAEAEGRLAVTALLLVALAYRFAWPITLLTALAADWASITEIEALTKALGR